MRGHPLAIVGIASLFACALIAAGCGGDDSTRRRRRRRHPHPPEDNATQSVDAAVKSCTDEAQQIGGVAGTALSGACTSVGAAATQAVATAGDNAQQALSQAASSCKSSVGQVPKGQAQDALTQLCDAIAAAGSG